jgi:hypothetical protein
MWTAAMLPPSRHAYAQVTLHVPETIRIYRDTSDTGSFSDGKVRSAGIAPKKRITLTEEPRGHQLEYRIIAVNTGGNSAPSNTAAVLL